MTQGIYATFMPKPVFGQNGSGMHTHQSLFKEGKNAFFDPDDKYHLSPIGKSYIAGLLKHAREICSIVAQWVNSYKRLVPGYEAPVYISWGQLKRVMSFQSRLRKASFVSQYEQDKYLPIL